MPMRLIPRKRKGEDRFAVLCFMCCLLVVCGLPFPEHQDDQRANHYDGTMYWSATDAAGGVGVGEAGAASDILAVVSAYEP